MQIDNNYKAFIIDDDEKILDMLKIKFEMGGFKCLTSSNPVEAIDYAENYIPDVIISDINMPQLDGFTLRKKIMERDSLKDVPFIFLTSVDTDENMLVGYDLNISDYLVKTTSLNVLLKKVHSVIKSHEKIRNEVKLNVKQEATKHSLTRDREKILLEDFIIDHLTIPFEDTPGGDFIEKIKLDENKYVFVLADVMGKRWDAWFHSFPFKSYIKAAVLDSKLDRNNYDVADVLTNLNSILYKDKAISSHSIALTIILIDTSAKILQAAGAGSLPLIKVNANGAVEELAPIECALGIIPNPGYKSISTNLNAGDRVLAFSDGLIEVPNRYFTQLGFAGLLDLMSYYHKDLDINWIEKLVRNYTNNKLTDDLTLLEIKRNG